MIKLEITDLIKEKHKDFIFGTNKKSKQRLYEQLIKTIKYEKKIKIKDILEYILENLEDIVTGDLTTLEKIIEEFNKKFRSLYKKEKKKLIEKLDIFLKEYKYFYTSPNWNAYIFLKELNISVCPYCNSQFIFVYEKTEGKKGRTRGNLDHFFDKSTYPFLALSIYNLVPSCKVCNSDFKGRKKVDLTNNYSPYEEGIVELIKIKRNLYLQDRESFKTIGKINDNPVDYISVLLGLENDFNICFDFSSASEDIQRKIKGNIDVFQLEGIYNTFHKQYVQDIIKKNYIYNYTYKMQLLGTYEKLFNSKDDLNNSLYNSIDKDKNILLGKLTRDIIEHEINEII